MRHKLEASAGVVPSEGQAMLELGGENVGEDELSIGRDFELSCKVPLVSAR
jgi:hypothetical protein